MARSLSSDDDGGQDDADGVPNPADELDEDEALELLAMPADLWQTAQDITGRAIPKQKLIRLWDRHHVHGTAETRAAAVLNSLLENTDETDQNNQRKEANTAIMTVRADAPRASTSAVPSRKRVISVRDDSDADNIDNRPKTARRLNEPSNSGPPRDSAASATAASTRLAAQRSVISIDSDEDDTAHVRRRAVRPGASHVGRPGGAAPHSAEVRSASSSASSTSVEPVGMQAELSPDRSPGAVAGPSGEVRRTSTPPTPIESEDKASQWLAQVLDMVPDVDTEHAKELIETHSEQPNCVEHVIEALFSKPYPKAKLVAAISKGKGRMSIADEAKVESDKWLNAETRTLPGPRYCDQASVRSLQAQHTADSLSQLRVTVHCLSLDTQTLCAKAPH